MDESEPTGMRLVISLWAPRLTKSICTFCAQLGKSVPFGGITSNSPGGQGWICTSRFCKHQTAWDLASHPMELMLLLVWPMSQQPKSICSVTLATASLKIANQLTESVGPSLLLFVFQWVHRSWKFFGCQVSLSKATIARYSQCKPHWDLSNQTLQ